MITSSESDVISKSIKCLHVGSATNENLIKKPFSNVNKTFNIQNIIQGGKYLSKKSNINLSKEDRILIFLKKLLSVICYVIGHLITSQRSGMFLGEFSDLAL